MIKLFLLTIILALTACANVPEEQGKVIEIHDEAVQTDVTELIESIRYVALQQPEDAYLTPVWVIVENDRIYSLDLYQRIFVHDINGLFLNILDRRGRGPGEYNSLSDFYVDDEYLYVLDGLMQKIFVYDNVSLQFIRDIRIPFRADDFVVLDDGGFLFAKFPRQNFNEQDENKRYRVIVTDSDLNVREKFFPYGADDYDALIIQSLSTDGDRICFSSFNEDAFYVFDRNEGRLLDGVRLSFDNPIPEKKRNDFTEISEGGYSCLLSVPVFCGGYMVLACGKLNEGCYYLYDGETFHKGGKTLGKNEISNIYGSKGDEFISLWGGSAQNYEQMVSNGFNRAELEVEAQMLDDVPYLIFYRMKELSED